MRKIGFRPQRGLSCTQWMLGVTYIAVDRVLHSSPVAKAVPDYQCGDGAARDKQPSQTAWQGPYYVHCALATLAGSKRTGPNVSCPNRLTSGAGALQDRSQFDLRRAFEFGQLSDASGAMQGEMIIANRSAMPAATAPRPMPKRPTRCPTRDQKRRATG